MPSTPSERLGLELQARGENVNSWGDTRLNEALKRLEEAVAGVETMVITGDIVLTSAFYVKNQARMSTLVLVGTPATNFRVTLPGVQKTYNVINLTPRIASFGVADMGTAPVRAGLSNLVVCDGTVTRVVDLTLDQVRTATGPVGLGGQRLTMVGEAISDTDAISLGQAVSLTSPQVARAQEWANKTGAVVDDGEYSAKEYAIGTTVPAGSAREWSVTTGGLVDVSEYAAKEYAIGDTVPAGSARRWAIGSIGDGSSKDWATLLSSIVAASEYSAKEYAVGATAPLGSAKRWAIATGVVADGLLGARGYANNSAASAQTSIDQATISTSQATISTSQATAAGNFATVAQQQADRATNAASQIINDFSIDPIARSPVPPTKDIVFSEGLIPRGLIIQRSVVGSRTNSFGVVEETAINSLRHEYTSAGRYLGVGIDGSDDVRLPTSPWLNPTEATLFFEGMVGSPTDEATLFMLGDGSTANVLRIYRRSVANGRTVVLMGTIGGNSVYNAILGFGALADGIFLRVAISTDRSQTRVALNGASTMVSHVSSRQMTLSALPTTFFGRGISGGAPWLGQVKRWSSIPRFLSTTDLENMTRLAA